MRKIAEVPSLLAGMIVEAVAQYALSASRVYTQAGIETPAKQGCLWITYDASDFEDAEIKEADMVLRSYINGFTKGWSQALTLSEKPT